MDSLRPPSKGLASKQSASSSNLSNSFSIRFNANDDSLDDIYNITSPPAANVSSTVQPSQQNSTAEDSRWKPDFLQTGFFGRKRSNSIENTSLSVSSLASLDPSPNPTPVSNILPMDTTTWARFKGKVNQAMEEIKSSSTSQKVGSVPATSSSVNSASHTAQSSISEDFYADPESESLGANGDADNSDDDVDSEIFNAAQDDLDPPASRLTRSMRHIRSNKEAIKGSLRKARESTKDKMFGRYKKADEATKSDIKKPGTDVEIESGVEMVEDMVLPANASAAALSSSDSPQLKSTDSDMKLRSTAAAPNELQFDCTANNVQPNATRKSPPAASSKFAHLLPLISSAMRSRSFALSLGLLAVLIVLPIPPFLQGVIACLFSIVTISTLYQAVCSVVMALVSENNPLGPEKAPFLVPDYDKMSVCEIPAAEEHTSLKCYSGWLNEVNNYDPDNYHLGMMKSVFIKLDGARLKLTNVANRVPKRSMWNEQVVEKKHLIMTMSRTFDLRNCRVEMMPKGLARKRYFNRKYPMQLIIPNGGGVSANAAGAVVTAEDDGPADNKDTANGGGTSSERTSPDTEVEKLLFLNDFDSTDFGTTILTADTSTLVKKEGLLKASDASQVDLVTPSSDETRLIFFARCDREKEDWYRRFQNASIGAVRDNENPSANFKYVTDKEAQAMRQVTQNLENLSEEERQQQKTEAATKVTTTGGEKKEKKDGEEAVAEETELLIPPEEPFEGLLMTPCSARSHPDYVKFMAKYQSACKRKVPPKDPVASSPERKSRRERKEDDLWKGIDQSLFLGPTADVIWANVLIGRVLYSCLNNDPMLEKIQDFLQKKLSAIKLPNFMEDVTIAQLDLGDKPPLIHRISQPLMDERGTWIDADLTYEGLVHATVTTKLNLLRLRKQQSGGGGGSSNGSAAGSQFGQQDVQKKKNPVSTRLQMSSIYDSDAESTGGSSSESEGSAPASTLIMDAGSTVSVSVGGQTNGVDLMTGTAAGGTGAGAQAGGGSSSRKLLRIVDKITASNLFQSATEISYVQRAMENMSTRIKLRVELKGLVARVVLNIPPPPSDRIWIGFRGPPRLWITAKPALGEHSVDWSIVTNVIENKLCEEVYKYLVYPNMVDVIVPILGQATYTEEE